MTIDEAERALASGNPIQAYSIAREAAADGFSDDRFCYLEVLSLARMGDAVQAQELYETYGLGSLDSVDALSLKARLLKDAALAEPEISQTALRTAAEAYMQAFDATGDTFPLINAATLAGAAGDQELSQSLANKLLEDAELASGEGYWPWITKAEALLLIGREDDALQAARLAVAQADASLGARSSTIRQFERLIPLSRAGAIPNRLLSILRPPPVLHFCGHIFADDGRVEARLAPEIQRFLDDAQIGIAYGALAAGADILIAELLLQRGAELNVVLPFPVDEFNKVSVSPAGDTWRTRFERCCSHAASITIVSDMPYVDDPRQIGYGTEVAMGMAVLRASHLAGRAVQLAIWDGKDTGFSAGTSADIATWAANGRAAQIIEFPEKRVPGQFQREVRTSDPGIQRGAHSILFADFSGFSKIGEDHLVFFWTGVMGKIAKVVELFSESILCKNTWGDALYLIVEGASAAAELALSLQEEVLSLDLRELGPESSGMRVALHYGTMYRAIDPVTLQTNFFGSEVSRTARLEPVTPKNSVYVTQPFAAVLSLKHAGEFGVHYVGALSFAKNYGKQAVYRLDRAQRNV